MRTTFSFPIAALAIVTIGFGFILSKYSILPGFGVIMVLLSFLAPLYKDPLSRLVSRSGKGVRGANQATSESKDRLVDDGLAINQHQKAITNSGTIEGGSRFSVTLVFATVIGFGFILSKYSILPGFGVIMVLLSFLAPLYKDPLSRLVSRSGKGVRGANQATSESKDRLVGNGSAINQHQRAAIDRDGGSDTIEGENRNYSFVRGGRRRGEPVVRERKLVGKRHVG